MIELRKNVERIVRPIRASNFRKDRMREELLTHLTTIYDEELAQHPNDAAGALAAAVERFGESDALRAELQAGVPRIEQVMCTPWRPAMHMFERRPGETVGEHVRRSCLRSMAINAVVWGLLLLFLWMMIGRRPERAHETSLAWFTVFAAAYVVCLFPVSVIGMMLLGEKFWRAWRTTRDDGDTDNRRRAVGQVLGYLLASMALYAAIAAAMLVLIMRAVAVPLVSDFWFWAIIGLSSLLGPPFLLLRIPDLNRWHAWESLLLEEKVPRTT